MLLSKNYLFLFSLSFGKFTKKTNGVAIFFALAILGAILSVSVIETKKKKIDTPQGMKKDYKINQHFKL